MEFCDNAGNTGMRDRLPDKIGRSAGKYADKHASHYADKHAR